MCLIIDINTLSCVFNESNSDYHEFKAVKEWVLNRNGKIVYGGTKYINELKKAPHYLKLFTHLNDDGNVVRLSDAKVDLHQEKIELEINDPKFNDPHIIAIIIESKCKILCSKDKDSYPYIQEKAHYPKGVKPPKIYSNKSNRTLLVDNNIAKICK